MLQRNAALIVVPACALALVALFLLPARPLDRERATPPWPARVAWLNSGALADVDRGAAAIREQDDSIVADLVAAVDQSRAGHARGPYALQGALLSLGNLGPRALESLPTLLRVRAELMHERKIDRFEYLEYAPDPEYPTPIYPRGAVLEDLVVLVRQEIALRIPYWSRSATLTTKSNPGIWNSNFSTVSSGGYGHSELEKDSGPPAPPRLHPVIWFTQWAIKRIVDPGDPSWWATTE
jgi:hypothetical protein